jgi:hypothetical protein
MPILQEKKALQNGKAFGEVMDPNQLSINQKIIVEYNYY